MSRKVLINRLAEVMKCKPEEIPNVNELTSNQIYWILQHEKLHERAMKNKPKQWDAHVDDKAMNSAVLNN